MNTLKKIPTRFINWVYRKKLKWLKIRMRYKSKETKLKSGFQKDSHSLLWVWEFSKKAVLICFGFYVIVQIYSMVVMAACYDFTHLGELINQTGEIVRDCVFAYLIKAGIENVGKIYFSRSNQDDSDDDNSDEAVG